MDAYAAARIVAELDPVICRIANRRATRSLPGEDLAQEGRIEAWQALCRHYQRGDPRRYAVTAATHGICTAAQRYGSLVRGVNYHNPYRQARWAHVESLEQPNGEASERSDEGAGDPIRAVADHSSLDGLLRWCGALLPRRHYQCVWLHAALGYGHPEVGRMLGLTPCTAETYYRRGLATLRRNRAACPIAEL